MESKDKEREIAALAFVKTVARMTKYKFSSTDELEDAVITLNRLIAEARKLLR